MLAVQALYQRDLRGTAFRDELRGFLESSTNDEETLSFAESLVNG